MNIQKACRILCSRVLLVLVAGLAFAPPAHAAGGSLSRKQSTTYTVVFHSGKKGATVSQKFRYGAKKPLRGNTFSKKGRVFRGWSRKATGSVAYRDRQVVCDLAPKSKTKVHLYARWAVRKYYVRFDANGGKGSMADQKLAYGKAARLKGNTFSRKNYVFLGWAKSAKAATPTYKSGQSVKNLTHKGGVVMLYAVWAKLGKENVVLCLGDSITRGIRCEGLPYPSRLAKLCGRKVVNYGNGGKTAAYGASIAEKALIAEGPGAVCILFGANDAVQNIHHRTVKENLRSIIRLCRQYNATPIIATPTPQIWDHAPYNENIKVIAADVRALAREEGAILVDLNVAFGDGRKYLNPDDGLHLSNAGGDLMAREFYRALP